jgi:hypothetical protein
VSYASLKIKLKIKKQKNIKEDKSIFFFKKLFEKNRGGG